MKNKINPFLNKMKTLDSFGEEDLIKARLFDLVKQFSFPRLAGTRGEEKSVELTVNNFRKIGFEETQIIKRRFEFTDFDSTTLIKLIMSMSMIFNLILILFVFVHVILSILFIFFMVVLIILIMRGLRHPENPGFWGEYFGDTLEATNVFSKVQAKELKEDKAANLIISAHLDSKSQSYTTFIRVLLYKFWLYGGIFIAIFYFLYLFAFFSSIPFDYGFTLYGAWISVIVVSTSNIFLMFLNTHNNSPGVLDNATGMALVFELSKYFLDNPLENFNLWFCQFSAEELGTMGSRFFANDHDDLFFKGKVFQINFDMLSCKSHKKNRIEYFKSYGTLIRRTNAPLLSKYFENAANNANIQINGFHLSTGAHTDTVPFHIRGWDAIDITTRAASLYAHTKNDDLQKIDPNVLYDAYKITLNMIIMMDNDYEFLCNSDEIDCGGG